MAGPQGDWQKAELVVEGYQRQEEDREVEEVPVEEADLQKPTVEVEEVEEQGLETNNQFIFLFTGVTP